MISYEDPVQSFWIISGCELTGILHVIFQIPKLAKANS